MREWHFLNYLHRLRDSEQVRKTIIRFKKPECYRQFVKLCGNRLHWQIIPSIYGIRVGIPSGPNPDSLFPDLIVTESDEKVNLKFSASPIRQSLSWLPSHQRLWGMERIRAREAWRYSHGEGVKVAVIDTGIDPYHQDLRQSLAAGVNLIDQHGLIHDDNGHGTHIAGTIAASRPGGLSGIAPYASIYSVKAFDQSGAAYISDIIRAVEWCVEQNVHIINMSFGMQDDSASLVKAIQFAERNGIIVVASAGNGGSPVKIDAPARYPEVISVGAINRDGYPASFSKHGTKVDIYAPGEHIFSTWKGGTYKHLNGSSMATAHVSGVIALMLSLRPELRLTALKHLLLGNGQTKIIDAVTAMESLFTRD